jgi:predicted RNA-binding protein
MHNEHQEVVMEDVIYLRIDGDEVTVSRFFEEPVALRASITAMDFLKHTVTLVPLEQSK